MTALSTLDSFEFPLLIIGAIMLLFFLASWYVTYKYKKGEPINV